MPSPLTDADFCLGSVPSTLTDTDSCLGSVPSTASTLLPWLLAATVLAPLALYVYMYPYTERRLPFRNLRGPKPTSGFFGDVLMLNTIPVGERYRRLMDEHDSSTLRIRALLGKWRIVSSDPVAVAYVLRHTGLFHRHPSFNAIIEQISGRGVLMAEDEGHRRQRRVLNSAFNGNSVANMVPMMWEEGYILKDNIDHLVDAGQRQLAAAKGMEKAPSAGICVDVLKAYTLTALDIIGRAGFNYHFHSHGDGTNPLSNAFNTMVNVSLENKLIGILRTVFPLALSLPTKNKRTVEGARAVLDDVGKEIVHQRKTEIARDHINLEKGKYEGKDVISLCLRANMTAAERDRMTDEEVLGQIGTLMLAGNETSATALGWASLHLTQNPAIQDRLREELLSVPDDRPTADELNALPYLDKFVRELLRFDPPLPQVVRTAVVDCVVPLGKPVVGRDGLVITEVHVAKGTDFVVPINNINNSEDIWGPDAKQFNPDRFDDPALPTVPVPGVFGNLLSFIGGPHNCLGYRFALLEIKTILFIMLRNFVLETIPTVTIVRESPGFVMRAVVQGEESKGIQMPVYVRRLEGE